MVEQSEETAAKAGSGEMARPKRFELLSSRCPGWASEVIEVRYRKTDGSYGKPRSCRS